MAERMQVGIKSTPVKGVTFTCWKQPNDYGGLHYWESEDGSIRIQHADSPERFYLTFTWPDGGTDYYDVPAISYSAAARKAVDLYAQEQAALCIHNREEPR